MTKNQIPTSKQLIPLHTHTVYSVLDGASDISEYVEWCKQNDSPALGITDHGWMIGLMDLVDQCKKNELTPLPGCEFYVVPDIDYGFFGKPYDYYHVTAWAINEKGYRNLLKLGSLSFKPDDVIQQYWDSGSKKVVTGPKHRVVKKFGEEKPRITFAELFENHEGLVIGSGCFLKGTQVKTVNGLKSIETVKSGDVVFNKEGLPTKVTAPTVREYKGDLVDIKITGVFDNIQATGNHEFLVSRGFGCHEWVEARDLSVGDRVVVPGIKREPEANLVFSSGELEIDFSSSEALWALGVFIAEGNWKYKYKNGKKYSLSGIEYNMNAEGDAESLKRLEAWLRGLGLNPKINWFRVKNGRKTKSGQLVCSSKYLAEIFYDVFQGAPHCDKKNIPVKFMSLSLDRLRYVLSGYFDGDGHFGLRNHVHKRTGEYQHKEICSATVSRQLAEQVQEVLNRAGIEHVVHCYLNKNYKKKRAYYIKITSSWAERCFQWLTGELDLCESPYRLLKVYSVNSTEYDGVVHCLNVEGDPSFTLASGVAVHNCLIGSINKALLQKEPSGAERNLLKMLDVFRGRFFLELMPHNCFLGGTLVDMSDGSQRPIEQIKIGDKVLCYDEKEKKVTSSTVTKTFVNPASEDDFVSLTFYGRGINKPNLVCTSNHPFFNGSGYTEAAFCKEGFFYAKQIKEHEKQIIDGHILGDASVAINDQFAYSQEEKRKSLVEDLAKIVDGTVSQEDRKGKGRTWRLSSYHPYFVGQRKRWYRDGKKIIPDDLIITPLLLSRWYCDDGTISRRQYKEKKYESSRLCTQGFIFDDQKKLQKKLKEQLGLECSIVKSKKSWCLSFDQENTKKLCEIISSFVDKSCGYKLATGFSPTKNSVDHHNDQVVYPAQCLHQSLVYRSGGNEKKNDYSKSYNIEVKGHHNYFVRGILVHNCTHNWDRKNREFTLNECNDFSPDGDLQKPCNLHNIELAKRHKLPLLMTIDSHFVHADQKAVQDVLLQNGNPDGWRFHSSYHMLTTEQAWDHWRGNYGDTKENRILFAEAVENNHVIAEMSDLKIEHTFQQPLVQIDLDVQAVPSEKDRLKLQIMRKIKEHGRMKWDDQRYKDRLNLELKVICDNGVIDFSRYFLFLEQWSQWTREHAILSAPGRGSGAGSLLCYLLKITHLDPFEFGLPFERFLSQGRLKRGKFPDIDWDLGSRDILLAKLAETYGENFAQCSTHGMLKIKSAIKDTCRVLLGWNSNHPKVNEITKTIPHEPQGVDSKDFLLGYTDNEGHIHEGHLDQNPKLAKFFEQYPDVYNMTLQLLGVPRSVGRHASAYFISDRPIWESAPLCNISGHVCTQFTAGPAEKAGLIKFDFLRVNTLADISNCIRLVQKRAGYKIEERVIKINGEDFIIYDGDLSIEKVPSPHNAKEFFDIYKLPESQGVFDDLSQGKTTSVFQMNTPLLTKACQDVRPASIEDLGAIVALVRPGPLLALIEDGETTMTNAYIERRAGRMPVTYAHPDLEPILKNTYGVAVYQEQLQSMFSDLAGYSPEEADEMREIFGKKKRQEMEKILPELKRRLRERGWTENQVAVFESLCISSASYSFNRAHSASYAMVAYQCAFLKHHYPLEWWTAVLQNAKVEDIKKKGYSAAVKDILVMPHVNGPTRTFELKDGKIHAPLYLIDGIGEMACSEFEKERKERGDFRSFEDVFLRVNKRVCSLQVFHRMILCGAFDQICPSDSYQSLITRYHVLRKADKKGQSESDLWKSMIKVYEKMKIGKINFDDVKELYFDQFEIENKRTEILSIYRMDVHDRFKKQLEHSGVLYGSDGNTTVYCQSIVNVLKNYSEINRHIATSPNHPVAFIGLVQDHREFQYKDKKSGEMVTACSVQVVNDGDVLECVLWPNIYKEDLPNGNPSGMVLVKGKIKPAKEPGKWSMWCDKYKALKGG